MEICSFGYLFCSCNVLNAELTKTEIALASKCEFHSATLTAVSGRRKFLTDLAWKDEDSKKQPQGKVLNSVDFIKTNFTSFWDVPHWLFYKHHKHWPLLALICLTKIPCKLAANRWMMFFLYTCVCLRLLSMETLKWASLFQGNLNWSVFELIWGMFVMHLSPLFFLSPA